MDRIPIPNEDLKELFFTHLNSAGVELHTDFMIPEWVMIVGSEVEIMLKELGTPVPYIVNKFLSPLSIYLHPKQAYFLMEEMQRVNKENKSAREEKTNQGSSGLPRC